MPGSCFFFIWRVPGRPVRPLFRRSPPPCSLGGWSGIPTGAGVPPLAHVHSCRPRFDGGVPSNQDHDRPSFPDLLCPASPKSHRGSGRTACRLIPPGSTYHTLSLREHPPPPPSFRWSSMPKKPRLTAVHQSGHTSGVTLPDDGEAAVGRARYPHERRGPSGRAPGCHSRKAPAGGDCTVCHASAPGS